MTYREPHNGYKMHRYKIIIEYNGTDFVGWQRQDNGLSVQEVIENAIAEATKEKVTIYGSGRTDAGVHALGQVAHFDLEKEFDPKKLRLSLNHFIGDNAVSILELEEMHNEFHARFDAAKRYYKYVILNREVRSVLHQNLCWHVRHNLDIEAMEKAAKHLEGKHDFSSFRASECQANSPIKTLDRIEIKKDGDFVILYFTAKSFLHHMVRNLVGTLKMVGEGKITPKDVKEILEAKDRTKAGINSPPGGLFFLKVDY